jgi:hypothetical protein
LVEMIGRAEIACSKCPKEVGCNVIFGKITDQAVTFIYEVTRSLFAFLSGLPIVGCAEKQCVSLRIGDVALRSGL